MTVSELVRALGSLPLSTEIYVRCSATTEPFAVIGGLYAESTERAAFIDLVPDRLLSPAQREHRYRDTPALLKVVDKIQTRGA